MTCEQPTDSGTLPVGLPDDGQLVVAAGATASLDVPYGSECTVVETNVPSGVTVSVTDSSLGTDGGNTDGVVVVDEAAMVATVNVTNTYPTPPLPETGADDMRSMLSLSGLLVWLGAGLVWATRRRAVPTG